MASRSVPTFRILCPLLVTVLIGCAEKRQPLREVFVCAPQAALLLTPKSGFKPIRMIPTGERLAVFFEEENWLKVRTGRGEEGWVALEEVAGMEVLEQARRMGRESAQEQAQFRARLWSDANLRLAPEKSAPFARRLPRELLVDVLARNVHGRSGGTGLYYKVRSEDGSAGWIAGRLAEPLLPAALDPYREERELGACLEIDRVTVGNETRAQYVLADRSVEASPEADFDRIRVFTWNTKTSAYGTAFVERGLRGILPITRAKTAEGHVLIRLRTLASTGEVRETDYVFKPPYFRRLAAR